MIGLSSSRIFAIRDTEDIPFCPVRWVEHEDEEAPWLELGINSAPNGRTMQRRPAEHARLVCENLLTRKIYGMVEVLNVGS